MARKIFPSMPPKSKSKPDLLLPVSVQSFLEYHTLHTNRYIIKKNNNKQSRNVRIRILYGSVMYMPDLNLHLYKEDREILHFH